jgi:exosortase/archaeosortase family protein
MVSLFLGEIHRLTMGARIGLVAAGFGAALLTNIGRAWLLAHTAAAQGIGAVAKFHDPAGYTIFTICLVIIAGIAEVLRRRHAVVVAAPALAIRRIPCPRRSGPALCIWAALIFAGTELWYRPMHADRSALWTIQPLPQAKPAPVSEAALSMLACDRQQSAVWRDDRGGQWTMFFFEWVPGTGRSAILARVHRPEICLPGVGPARNGKT